MQIVFLFILGFPNPESFFEKNIIYLMNMYLEVNHKGSLVCCDPQVKQERRQMRICNMKEYVLHNMYLRT